MKTVGVYIENQDAALDFYRDKLGFELRRRLSMGTGGDWIEVAPPGDRYR